jgi:hypothetical protein
MKFWNTKADGETEKKPLSYLARVWLNLCAHKEGVDDMIASIVDGKEALQL